MTAWVTGNAGFEFTAEARSLYLGCVILDTVIYY